MHAEKCPVCKGTGRKNKEPSDEGMRDCYGCDGKGWVTVEDETPPKATFVTNSKPID
jgi:DnaJ-class molecular chaperone